MLVPCGRASAVGLVLFFGQAGALAWSVADGSVVVSGCAALHASHGRCAIEPRLNEQQSAQWRQMTLYIIIYIYIYVCIICVCVSWHRPKGPCRDCLLQRPPVSQKHMYIIYIYMYVCICMYVYVYMYVYMYMYMYMYVYVCMCVCVCVM